MSLIKLFFTILLINVSANAQLGLYQPGLPIRCLGMGGACTANILGANSLYINPAALARVQGFDFIAAQAQVGASKDAIDFASNFQGSSFQASDLNNLYGKTLVADVTARGAFAMPNFAFGAFSNNYTTMQFNDPVFPTFDMGFISDYGYALGAAIPISEKSSFGLTAKHIKRWGGQESINVASIIGASTTDIASQNFDDHGVGHSLDIAFMTTLGESSAKPTLSLVWQNIGVTTYSLAQGNKAPPSDYDNLIFGASVQQELGIFNLTHAFDYTHIRTDGYDLPKKLHLGTEASLGPLDLRVGLNQGYLTYGLGLDLWLFQIDAAAYATELGTYSGQERSDRYSVSLTFNLDFDDGFKLRNNEGKKRRLNKRR